MTTIILPCAGLGTRLGLPYPKEIHRISKSYSLVDFSLDHIEQAGSLVEQVVTVLAPGKESVYDYIAQRMTGLCDMNQVYFNNSYSEWPGSVKSAETRFSERNIVLLPDSIIETREREPLISQFNAGFDAGADLVFAYVPETERTRLSALGALSIEDGAVTDFCDKPSLDNPKNFAGFWASFGFKRSCSTQVLDLMMKSVAREAVDIQGLNLNVMAFPIARYTDLGTWESVSEFLDCKKALR